jgi:exosome complex component RRP41
MDLTGNATNVSAVNLRPDGRAPGEFRSTKFQLNVMKNADGSCFYEQGNAKVLCSVFGPLQRFRMRKLDDAAILRCHMYRSRFAGNDRQKRKARSDKETHLLLEQVLNEVIILDNYPRTRIDIVFRILQSDGNNVAVCLNAANFALMDAGLNMRGVLTVANCTYINETVIVDVCDQDEQDTSGSVSIGSISGQRDATFVDLKGCFARETFKEVMGEALKTCERLHEHFVNLVTEELRRVHKETTPFDEATGDLGLAKLKIYEPGDEQPIENVQLEEYDLAFEQVISDSEEEMEES